MIRIHTTIAIVNITLQSNALPVIETDTAGDHKTTKEDWKPE